MLRYATIAVIALLPIFSTAAIAAEDRDKPNPYTSEQTIHYNACVRDTVRWCKDVPPEDGPMLNCLKTNRAKLSVPCRTMLESHGQ